MYYQHLENNCLCFHILSKRDFMRIKLKTFHPAKLDLADRPKFQASISPIEEVVYKTKGLWEKSLLHFYGITVKPETVF